MGLAFNEIFGDLLAIDFQPGRYRHFVNELGDTRCWKTEQKRALLSQRKGITIYRSIEFYQVILAFDPQ